MVKVTYNGDISPCSIKIKEALYTDWSTGEIKDISEAQARKVIKDNKNFSLANKEDTKRFEERAKTEGEAKEKVAYDLDGDGDFDKDDLTIAAKTMAAGRKKK